MNVIFLMTYLVIGKKFPNSIPLHYFACIYLQCIEYSKYIKRSSHRLPFNSPSFKEIFKTIAKRMRIIDESFLYIFFNLTGHPSYASFFLFIVQRNL